MGNNTRITNAQIADLIAANTASQQAVAQALVELKARVNTLEKARVTPSTRKATTKGKGKATKAQAPKGKGVQTRETLSRKDWNRTLTTLAKTRTGKNSGAYKKVLDSWADMQVLRNSGKTPVEALATLGFNI